MSTRTVLLLTTTLIVLALAPWITSSCASRPLVPDKFAAERNAYETRVAESQLATRTAERQLPGEVNVVIISESADDEYVEATDDPEFIEEPEAMIDTPTATFEFTATPEPTAVSDSEEGTGEPTEEPAEAPDTSVTASSSPTIAATRTSVSRTEGESTTTVRVIGTVTASLPMTTTIRVVVQSEQSPLDAAETPAAPAATASVGAPSSDVPTSLPALPMGMVEVEDVITDSALRARLEADAAGSGLALSELSVGFQDDGVRAAAMVEILPNVRQPVEVLGGFAVENDSLVFKVDSIRLNNRDVTGLYGGQLATSVNSSLYRLLPQRYVQSFVMADDQLVVKSFTRSP